MAEETQAPAAPLAPAPPAEVVVEKKESEEKQVVTTPEPESTTVAATEPTDVVVEAEKPKGVEVAKTEEEGAIAQSVSFKEESNRVSDLQDPEKKALDELKQLIQQALNNHEFTAPPPPPPPPPAAEKEEEKPAAEAEEPAVEGEAEKAPEPPVAVEGEKPAAAPALAPVEEEKAHAPPPPPVEEEIAPPPSAASEAASEPAVVVVEEDGTKTVEAIEETIVAVQPSKETAEVAAAATEAAAEAKEGGGDASAEAFEESAVPRAPEEVSIWGIALLADERSDVILLKFLRARDFKVKDAFTMIKNTVRWRKEFGIEALLEEDLGTDLEKVVFMDGFDKEGHPVCYNVYGEFRNKELYQKTFSDEEKSQKFLRWRIQFLEKSIRKLDFSPGGICTIVQVNDLKNSPGPFKRELRQATNQALYLLQDNYPEFVAKQIFINVPWWYLAFNRMISPFLTQRTKSKFVFAGPSKSAETLFRYVAPEQVPTQYGGLKKEGEQEFSTADPVTEVIIKPTTKQTVEFPVSETSLLVWEVRVVGWEVTYGAEFVPSAEDGYTVIVQKSRKFSPSDEPVICNSFKIGEPGKVVLTIENLTSKKKKLLYRSKTKPCSD
ncbi:hypothetical protein Scep_019472 [Stephania cephalantha]|uniref:Patellin-3 n=1 Tax=Stephania cephalantha TaxID=152367 RepID=A0AAP0NM61_9MAGN